MRTLSVAAIKGRTKSSGILPRQGTCARKVYDLLHDSFGLPVNLSRTVPDLSKCIENLMDIYGCDIRRVERSTYVLVGEWTGKTYRDYCLIRELLKGEDQDA